MRRLKTVVLLLATGMTSISGFSQTLSGTYELVNANSGMVLDVLGRATTNGASVGQWIGNGGGNRHWTITSLGNGQDEIANVLSGLGLVVYNQSTAAGAAVDQRSYLGGVNQ